MPDSPNANGIFYTVPIEILQHIAKDLPDKDLGTFRSLCRTTKNAIDADGDSFWRRRCLETFEIPVSTLTLTNHKMKMILLNCKRLLKVSHNIDPKDLSGKPMEYLKFLVKFAEPTNIYLQQPASKNLEYIQDFEKRTQFVRDAFCNKFATGSSNQVMQAILVVLGSWMLDPLQYKKTWGFGDSQFAAYASPAKQPVLKSKAYNVVNISWVLHLINFFRLHLCSDEQIGLRRLFMEMPWFERPALWRNRLSNENILQNIGKTWRGTYAYLDREEVIRLRLRLPAGPFIDRNVDLEDRAFQNLKIKIIDNEAEAGLKKWPPVFTHILEPNKVQYPVASEPMHHASTSNPSSCTSTKKVRFEGIGYDDEIFYVTGYINPLPTQAGIQGWSRMTMMKYFHNEHGQVDTNGLWAYEGIICPGGQMMLGRWWSPENVHPADLYTGPFIFWCTDLGFTEKERELTHVAGLAWTDLTKAGKKFRETS